METKERKRLINPHISLMETIFVFLSGLFPLKRRKGYSGAGKSPVSRVAFLLLFLFCLNTV